MADWFEGDEEDGPNSVSSSGHNASEGDTVRTAYNAEHINSYVGYSVTGFNTISNVVERRE